MRTTVLSVTSPVGHLKLGGWWSIDDFELLMHSHLSYTKHYKISK